MTVIAMTSTSVDEKLLMEYKRYRSIQRLARSCAHNYNNIFAALSGQIGMALKDQAAERNIERKNTIEELLQRGTVLTDLLYGFTLEREGEKRNHSPGVLCNKAVSLLNIVSRQHHFHSTKEPQIAKCYGNSHDIVLALFYLGENCIESMPEGGKARIHLGMRQKNGNMFVAFSVCDTGRGFDKEILDRAFEPDVASAEDIPRKELGVFAVKKIVEENNGDIAIEPAEEGGTCVTVFFPAAVAQPQTSALRFDPGSQQESVIQAGEAKVLLVVDDEKSMRKMIIERLERRGHTAYGASTCKEAVSMYQQLADRVQYILLDIRLGDMQGTKCALKLRAVSEHAGIIFMSGVDNPKEREEFSCFPFLRKPFSIKDIEKILYHGDSKGT